MSKFVSVAAARTILPAKVNVQYCIRFLVRTPKSFIPLANNVIPFSSSYSGNKEDIYIQFNLSVIPISVSSLAPFFILGCVKTRETFFPKNNVQISISSPPCISPVREQERHDTRLKIVLIKEKWDYNRRQMRWGAKGQRGVGGAHIILLCTDLSNTKSKAYVEAPGLSSRYWVFEKLVYRMVKCVLSF